MITYRTMQEGDLEEALSIFKLFHEEAQLPYPIEDEALLSYLRLHLVNDNMIALAVVDDGEVVGGLLGMIIPSIYDGKTLVAYQTHWFVKKEHRGKGYGMKLHLIFSEFAKLKDAKFQVIQVRKFSTSFARRHNYRFLDQLLVREV